MSTLDDTRCSTIARCLDAYNHNGAPALLRHNEDTKTQGSPFNSAYTPDIPSEKIPSLGSISREDATFRFPFLSAHYSGRRAAIREFTHRDPDFVFWIYPDGKLCNAHNSHLKNPPRGFEHILKDEPHYGGFLRGRVASLLEDQLIVVYCEESALAHAGKKLTQFMKGVQQLSIIIRDDALVISDNGDIYGTLDDLVAR